MGFADDVRDLLSTGVSPITAEIFCGDLPERPATALCVATTAGFGSTHTFGSVAGQAPFERLRCQVRARAGNYLAAEALITSVHTRLDGLRNEAMNGKLYQWMVGTTTPYYIGLDEAAQPLFGCNYDAYMTRTT